MNMHKKVLDVYECFQAMVRRFISKLTFTG
jgi:hypothetical protein